LGTRKISVSIYLGQIYSVSLFHLPRLLFWFQVSIQFFYLKLLIGFSDLHPNL